jgi:protein-disulfide isomerase
MREMGHSGLAARRVLCGVAGGLTAAAIALVEGASWSVAALCASDVASALASGVNHVPALFVNGERYTGELDPGAVTAALEDGGRVSAAG